MPASKIRIYISGMGIAINDKIGLNVLSAAYIEIKQTANAIPRIFAVVKSPSVGGNSGTLVIGHVQTDWFDLDLNSAAEMTLAKLVSKKNRTIDLEVKNMLLGSGKCDIKATLINDKGVGLQLFERFDIPCIGGQLSETKIRGDLRHIPGLIEIKKAG